MSRHASPFLNDRASYALLAALRPHVSGTEDRDGQMCAFPADEAVGGRRRYASVRRPDRPPEENLMVSIVLADMLRDTDPAGGR
jgi:hypothetical protein